MSLLRDQTIASVLTANEAKLRDQPVLESVVGQMPQEKEQEIVDKSLPSLVLFVVPEQAESPGLIDHEPQDARFSRLPVKTREQLADIRFVD